MEGATNNWFSNKYSIGYALSGGFIKGFAHLGAMQALLEHDIKPNIISGVSAGGWLVFSMRTATNLIKFWIILPGINSRI